MFCISGLDKGELYMNFNISLSASYKPANVLQLHNSGCLIPSISKKIARRQILLQKTPFLWNKIYLIQTKLISEGGGWHLTSEQSAVVSLFNRKIHVCIHSYTISLWWLVLWVSGDIFFSTKSTSSSTNLSRRFLLQLVIYYISYNAFWHPSQNRQ